MTISGTALVIDDEPHVRKFIGLILRSIGATAVIEAGDGAEGVATYKREKPVLVMLDVNMPGQDGIETLKQIRAFDPQASVIMLTSLANRQTIEDAADGGALHYIRKDTPREQLVELIKEALAEEASGNAD